MQRAPRWWWFHSLGGLHALLAALSFEPVAWWPLAWVSLLPLFIAAITTHHRPARSGLLVAAGVFPLWVYQQIWLIDVAGLWFVLLACYLSLFPGALVAFAGLWSRRAGRAAMFPLPLVVAVAWTALEVLRGEVVWGGYAWYLACHPLIEVPWLAAPAAIGGAYVVLFFLALACASVAHAVVARRLRPLVGLGFAAALWIGVGIANPGMSGTASVTARLALVQTNIRTDNKEDWSFDQRTRDFERFADLTRQAATADPPPDLIAWPETMFPGLSLNHDAVDVERRAGFPAEFHARLIALQQEVGVPMLVGGLAREGLELLSGEAGTRIVQRRKYNSAFMVRAGRVEPHRYDKIELMAFGEVVPYAWRWKRLQQWIVNLGVQGWSFDLAWGAGPTAFDLSLPARAGRPAAAIGVATPICFEGTMPRVSRALAHAAVSDPGAALRPGLLINLTNDGWFGRWPGGREQHLQTMRWRAVETRLPVARCANTGISALILPDGAVAAQLPPWTDGVLSVDVPAPAVSPARMAPAAGLVIAAVLILAATGLVWLLLPGRIRHAPVRPAPQTPRAGGANP